MSPNLEEARGRTGGLGAGNDDLVRAGKAQEPGGDSDRYRLFEGAPTMRLVATMSVTERLARIGAVPPMIAVMPCMSNPDGVPHGRATNWIALHLADENRRKGVGTGRFGTFLTEELVCHVDRHFDVSRRAEHVRRNSPAVLLAEASRGDVAGTRFFIQSGPHQAEPGDSNFYRTLHISRLLQMRRVVNEACPVVIEDGHHDWPTAFRHLAAALRAFFGG